MTNWIAIFGLLTIVLSLAALPGILELSLLTVAGLLPVRQHLKRALSSYRLAVVIPAHNEELDIERCLASVLAADQTGLQREVIVIADNCTDHTAALARQLNVRVLERTDKTQRGKGFALDFAFRQLAAESFQGFLVIDADSTVSFNALTEIAAFLAAGADAVQCRYLVHASDASLRSRLTKLASGAYNILRARGRDRLGCSVGIYGNGFALSADLLRVLPYLARSVVEDAEYHLTLVKAGFRVLFADAAAVYAPLPMPKTESANVQRTRWEGGRLRLLAHQGLRLIPTVLRDVTAGRFRSVEPLLDLLLLPLSFHMVLLLLTAASPFLILRCFAGIGMAMLAVHLIAANRVIGGGRRDLLSLFGAPFYVAWKIVLLPRLIWGARNGAAWVRTERVGMRK